MRPAGNTLRLAFRRKRLALYGLMVSAAGAAVFCLLGVLGSFLVVVPLGAAVVTVAVDETIQPGHVSLPNGFGLDHVEAGARSRTGVGTNEFTASEDRDPWAGTPWHKTTPARLEPV